MGSYSLFIKPSAARELEAVPPKDRKRVVARIQKLSANPRPPGCEKLSGEAKYRVRQGNYRVLYTINDDVRAVTVVKVGDRREVYR